MKFAVVSDIHANKYALEAVQQDAGLWIETPGRCFWSLGNVVGVGPHPEFALAFLRDDVDQQRWVMGNHDAMLADLMYTVSMLPGTMPPDFFRFLPIYPDGVRDIIPVQTSDGVYVYQVGFRRGEFSGIIVRNKFLGLVQWAQYALDFPFWVWAIQKNITRLLGFPDENCFRENEFTLQRKGPLEFEQDGIQISLVHGSRNDPLGRYLNGWEEIFIQEEINVLNQHHAEYPGPVVQFYGGTNKPVFVRVLKKNRTSVHAEKITPGQTFLLEKDSYYLINPGSVGQPRDWNVKSSYIRFDSHDDKYSKPSVTFRRVQYENTNTGMDLVAQGYPNVLVDRLRDAQHPIIPIPDDWLAHYDAVKDL